MMLFRATEDASGQIHIIGGCGLRSHATWLSNPTDAMHWARAVANENGEDCHIEWHRPFRAGGAASLQLPCDVEPAR